jgi:hypothetical protein
MSCGVVRRLGVVSVDETGHRQVPPGSVVLTAGTSTVPMRPVAPALGLQEPGLAHESQPVTPKPPLACGKPAVTTTSGSSGGEAAGLAADLAMVRAAPSLPARARRDRPPGRRQGRAGHRVRRQARWAPNSVLSFARNAHQHA